MVNRLISAFEWAIDLSKKKFFLFCVFLAFFTVFRSGFALYGLMWRHFQNPSVGAKSIDQNLIAKIQDGPTINNFLMAYGETIGSPKYFLTHTIFIIVCISIIVAQVSYKKIRLRPRLIFLLSLLPASAIILQRYGTYDTICLMMCIIGVLSKSKYTAFFAAMLFTLTNPEASFVSGLSLLLLSLASRYKQHKEELKLPVGVLAFGFFQILLALPLIALDVLTNNSNSTLSSIFFTDSINALAQLLASGPLLVFSWFGPFWLILYNIFRHLNYGLINRLLMVIVFIGCGTLIASDGTRNSALGLTSLTVCLLFSNVGLKFVENISRTSLLGLYLIPAINISNFNIVLPFYQVIYVFDLGRPYIITN